MKHSCVDARGTEAMPGRHVGGCSAIVHGKQMKHTKFGLPHEKREGHEIFHNEKSHSSTEKADHKFFAHIK
jgi:hypothetical protein